MTFTPTIPALFSSLFSRFTPPSRAEMVGSPVPQGSAPLLKTFPWCLSVLLLLAVVSTALAQWGRTADDYIELPLCSPPTSSSALCSDLNGGCWVAGEPIGLCHMNRLGNVTWGDSALWFEEMSFRAKIVPFDTNSVLVGMVRAVNDTAKVFLNRVTTNKELLWGEDGLPLLVNGTPQGIYDLIPGPIPNTFIIHCATPDREVRLLDSHGETLWDSDGQWPYWTESAKVLTTGDQGVIVAHPVDPYPTQNPLVEIIKFNAEGEQLWLRRYAITSELQPILRGWELSDVESDRDGGVIISTMYKRWNAVRDSLKYFSLGIMRVSEAGDSLWMHKVYERQVEWENPYPGPVIDPFETCDFILNYAGTGNFFAAWVDNLRYSEDDPFKVISFDSNFELMWGEAIDVIDSPAESSSISGVDSDSSVCYVWRDREPERGNDRLNEQWGQRIGLNGERLWGDRGRVIISHTPSRQSATTDCNGGIITVVDVGNPCVQLMNRNGEIGVVLDPVSVDDDFDNTGQVNRPTILSIFPNPGNSSLTISLSPVLPNEIINYQIYDLMGRSVAGGTISGFPYLMKDLTGFSSGDYILQIKSPQVTLDQKFSLVK